MLPQDVELFDGSLVDNIARFGEVDQAKVEAAQPRWDCMNDRGAAGYDTEIGDEVAFFRRATPASPSPGRFTVTAFIVLDEPNSSLDEAGSSLCCIRCSG